MSLATGGLPAAAAHENRTVVAVTMPTGQLVSTSWELGEANPPFEPVKIDGPDRLTDVAPAISFRTTLGGYSIWLAIKDSSDGSILETLEIPGGRFSGWTEIPGLRTNVSTAMSDGNLAAGIPMMVALAPPPDYRLHINYLLNDQPPPPPGPPGYWQPIALTITSLAPVAALVDGGGYIFLATTSLNFAGGPHGTVMLHQGSPFDRDHFVTNQQMNFNSNVSPAMASANNRTVIVAADPDGIMFYNWWDFGGGGHGWIPLGDDVRTSVAPAVAVLDHGNYMFVVARGADNEIHLNQGQVGGTIVGWSGPL
jgi:hypothetical protein